MRCDRVGAEKDEYSIPIQAESALSTLYIYNIGDFHSARRLSTCGNHQSAETPQNSRSFSPGPTTPATDFKPLPGLPVGSTAGDYAGGLGWPGGWRAGWPSRWRGGWRYFVVGVVSRGGKNAGMGRRVRKWGKSGRETAASYGQRATGGWQGADMPVCGRERREDRRWQTPAFPICTLCVVQCQRPIAIGPCHPVPLPDHNRGCLGYPGDTCRSLHPTGHPFQVELMPAYKQWNRKEL